MCESEDFTMHPSNGQLELFTGDTPRASWKGIKKPHVVALGLDLQPRLPHGCSLQRLAFRWRRVWDPRGPRLPPGAELKGGLALNGRQGPRTAPFSGGGPVALGGDRSAHGSAAAPLCFHCLPRRSLFISSPSSPSPPPLPPSLPLPSPASPWLGSVLL